jgi:hypothetical protein
MTYDVGKMIGSAMPNIQERLRNAGDRRDWDECDRLEELKEQEQTFNSMAPQHGIVIPKNQVIYLASPYSHPEESVRYGRYYKVIEATSDLIKQGYLVYAPIVHNHVITITPDIPKDFSFWKTFDVAMLKRCDAIAVLKLEGWEKSIGIQHELTVARYLHYPIYEVYEKSGKYELGGERG